jgi:uncharacterized SAM-dependent methyltransferase
MPTGAVRFLDLSPVTASFLDDVLSGLARQPKVLAPKYFYDAVGSALFDAICALEEYYPTRTETALMREHAGEIAERVGGNCALIEFGSGMSRKSQILIEAAQPAVYVPLISRNLARGVDSRAYKSGVVAVCGLSAALAVPTY